MTEDRGPSIKVTVPESYGPAFGEGEDRQWVQRRVYVGRDVRLELTELTDKYEEDAAFERLCEIFSGLFTAWSLTDESGEVLPDPWKNPKAFETLADISEDLFIWLGSLVHTPLRLLVTVEKN